jgi:hypothetical protein
MNSDLLGHVNLEGRRLGSCYFPAVPDAGQYLRAGDTAYRITAVGWVVPPFDAGRGLAEINIDVAPLAE